MKTFAFKARLTVGLLVILLSGSAAVAQLPGAGGPTAVNTAFLKLFGNVGAFTAKAETRIVDPYERDLARLPMEFAAADGKVRIEINIAQMKSQDMSPGKIAELKQSGMDRVISLFRPDKKATYIIYPGIQSYVSSPLPKGDDAASGEGLKVEKTALGNETIDGHACVKNKLVVRNDQGPLLQAVTWNAADLKDFPLQIEMKQKHNTVRMDFTQVRFTKLDAQQFNVPAGYGEMK